MTKQEILPSHVGDEVSTNEIIPHNPMEIIATMASNPDCDPGKLQQLMDLQERWEDRRAAREFATALAAFQAECPVIVKKRTASIRSKKGNGASYSYGYAPLEDIMEVIKPLLAANGLAVSFHSSHANNMLHMVCRVACGTHAEESTFTCPVPDMLVNDAQRMGAAQTYARRYALCAALNITVADEDMDGRGVVPNAEPQQNRTAAKSGTRKQRASATDRADDIYTAYASMGGREDNWWSWFQKQTGKTEYDQMTDDDWDKLASLPELRGGA